MEGDGASLRNLDCRKEIEGTVSTNTETAVVLEPGTPMGCGWVVERPIAAPGGLVAALLHDEEGVGRAIGIVLPPDREEPPLDEAQAAHWGIVRRVLPDEVLGRVVIDEVPDGPLLAERLVPGKVSSAGILDPLASKMRVAHRKGFAHGALHAEMIVLGDDGLAAAGWGIAQGSIDALKARDMAAVAALQGRAAALATVAPMLDDEPVSIAPPPAPAAGDADADYEPTGLTGSTAIPAGNAALRAAIRSDSLSTLREALASFEAGGGAAEDGDALRARDALARLERRIDEHLDRARALLAQGDTLGVVASCREAIRLGAEDEARPILDQARRTTRRQLSTRKLPPPGVLISIAGGVVIFVLLLVAGLLALREAPEDEALRAQAQTIAEQQGWRESVSALILRREEGDRRELVRDLLGTHLEELARSERERLLARRDEVVATGARPRQADVVAEEAMQTLDALAAEGADAPALSVQLVDALAEIDRASALYRASTELSAPEAERAVEALLARDPVFVSIEGGAGR